MCVFSKGLCNFFFLLDDVELWWPNVYDRYFDGICKGLLNYYKGPLMVCPDKFKYRYEYDVETNIYYLFKY